MRTSFRNCEGVEIKEWLPHPPPPRSMLPVGGFVAFWLVLSPATMVIQSYQHQSECLLRGLLPVQVSRCPNTFLSLCLSSVSHFVLDISVRGIWIVIPNTRKRAWTYNLTSLMVFFSAGLAWFFSWHHLYKFLPFLWCRSLEKHGYMLKC